MDATKNARDLIGSPAYEAAWLAIAGDRLARGQDEDWLNVARSLAGNLKVRFEREVPRGPEVAEVDWMTLAEELLDRADPDPYEGPIPE